MNGTGRMIRGVNEETPHIVVTEPYEASAIDRLRAMGRVKPALRCLSFLVQIHRDEESGRA